MEKRYQVFVSSTFTDLQEERKEVMQALLELNCIPCGMELFPAANEDQWSLIKRMIDDCDYYILIVGGRYGSTDTDGISYTEKEYRYALEQSKPIIAFLPKYPELIPSGKSDNNQEASSRLQRFKELAQKKLVKYWTNPENLGSLVSRSIVNLIRDFPAIGWVKADNIANEDMTLNLIKLQKENDELKAEISQLKTEAPTSAQNLAQGESQILIGIDFSGTDEEFNSYSCNYNSECTWNEIFAIIAPYMISECSESSMKTVLSKFLEDKETRNIRKDETFSSLEDLSSFEILEEDFQIIKVQFRALGLITQSKKPRSVKDTVTRWSLTPYGDFLMTQLCAIKNTEVPETTSAQSTIKLSTDD